MFRIRWFWCCSSFSSYSHHVSPINKNVQSSNYDGSSNICTVQDFSGILLTMLHFIYLSPPAWRRHLRYQMTASRDISSRLFNWQNMSCMQNMRHRLIHRRCYAQLPYFTHKHSMLWSFRCKQDHYFVLFWVWIMLKIREPESERQQRIIPIPPQRDHRPFLLRGNDPKTGSNQKKGSCIGSILPSPLASWIQKGVNKGICNKPLGRNP